MRDVAGEDHKPEPRGNPDVDVIKGDNLNQVLTLMLKMFKLA